MFSLFGSVAAVVASILVSLAALWIIQWAWEPSRRRSHNDVIGPSVGVIGTTYAVIVAFMLSGVWSNFQTALRNTEVEANSLVSLSRLGRALPSPEREQIQQLTLEYAKVMIEQEWSAMTRQELSARGQQIMNELWTLLPATQAHSPQEQAALQQALAELSSMSQHRRIRVLESRTELPNILWAVLLVGGVVTVGASCLFGVEDFKIHALQVGALSLTISIVLVAIADIDHPFEGIVHVTPSSFQYALETFQEATAPSRAH
jgi:hypothetical protein